MLFLAQGTIRHTPYMDEPNDFEVIRLVQADSKEEAESKFNAEYDQHDDPYGFGHQYVRHVSVTDVIL